MRAFPALVATYVLVASLGWVNGYLTRSYLDGRRARPRLAPVVFIDLADNTGPYDWARDGECVAAP